MFILIQDGEETLSEVLPLQGHIFAFRISKKWLLRQPLHQSSWLGWVGNQRFLFAFWIKPKLKKSNKNNSWTLKHQSKMGKGSFTDLIQRDHLCPQCDCDPPTDSMEHLFLLSVVNAKMTGCQDPCTRLGWSSSNPASFVNPCCLKTTNVFQQNLDFLLKNLDHFVAVRFLIQKYLWQWLIYLTQSHIFKESLGYQCSFLLPTWVWLSKAMAVCYFTSVRGHVVVIQQALL